MEKGLKQGPITANQLMQNLAKAKKVMNKVDSGDYVTGQIDEGALVSDEASDYEIADRMLTETEPVVNTRPVNSGNMDIDKINNSKLPESIKKAMIENPIGQISLNDNSLSMDFVNRTRQLMESEGVAPKSTGRAPQRNQPTKQASVINNTELITILTPIIENVVRKVMDEKLNQILAAQTTSTINENLVLKVGDSIFKGKITGVQSAK